MMFAHRSRPVELRVFTEARQARNVKFGVMAERYWESLKNATETNDPGQRMGISEFERDDRDMALHKRHFDNQREGIGFHCNIDSLEPLKEFLPVTREERQIHVIQSSWMLQNSIVEVARFSLDTTRCVIQKMRMVLLSTITITSCRLLSILRMSRHTLRSHSRRKVSCILMN